MIVWGALLLPLITAWILHQWYRRHMEWWEYALPLCVSLLVIALGKWMAEYVDVRSQEYWGSFVEKAEYYEDWNEYIHKTCTSTCCCDKDGKNCQTTHYDCSYVDYHPEFWELTTSLGEEIRIDKPEFERLVRRFGKPVFVDLRRHFHTNDGDKYVSTWNRDSASAEPATTLHYYDNRVKVSDHSIFHARKISEAAADSIGLFDYPPITDEYRQVAVLGDSSPDAVKANLKLRWWNAALGHEKEVRLFALVFHDQPLATAILQEWHWCGANMNEFVVAIGVDRDRRVQWCHPISWTRAEILKPRVRQFVEAQDTLNLAAMADFLGPQIRDNFIRRDFKEFNYLTVEPSTLGVVFIYLATALACFGTARLAITNGVGDTMDGVDEDRGYHRRYL